MRYCVAVAGRLELTVVVEAATEEEAVEVAGDGYQLVVGGWGDGIVEWESDDWDIEGVEVWEAAGGSGRTPAYALAVTADEARTLLHLIAGTPLLDRVARTLGSALPR